MHIIINTFILSISSANKPLQNLKFSSGRYIIELCHNKEAKVRQLITKTPLKLKNRRATIFSLYKFFYISHKKPKLLFLIIIGCLIFSILFDAAMPLLFAKIFDVALPDKNGFLVLKLLFCILLLFIFAIWARYLQSVLTANIAAKMLNYLRIKMFQSVQNAKASLYPNRHAEENILIRFTEDLVILEQTIMFAMWGLIQNLLNAFVCAIIMVYVNWALALPIFVMLCVIQLPSRYFANKASAVLEKKQNTEAKLMVIETEAILMQKQVRFLRLKKYKRKLFKNQIKNIIQLASIYNANLNLSSRSSSSLIDLISLLILSLGALFVLLGYTTLGNLIAFILLYQNLGGQLSGAIGYYPNITKGVEAFKRISALIEQNAMHRPTKNKKILTNLVIGIDFNNVSVIANGKPIVSNISFSVPIGKSIAVVGPSGAGKSTLLNLLLAEMPITQGNITYDNVDLTEISFQSLYSCVGVVWQEPKLFAGTIRENIQFGNLNATEDDIIAAAILAEVHDDIIALPFGYDTEIDQHQSFLSGGQAQRIAVARTLIGKPPLLCLDEATSALDPINAAKLEQTFINLKKNMTIFSITHRLASTVNFDSIIVLENGRIVEQGTHGELMKQKKLYFKLWEKQHGITFAKDLSEATISSSWLRKIPMFKNFNEDFLKILSEQFLLEKIQPDHIVFEENDYGNKFYIVASGILEVTKAIPDTSERKFIAKLSEGDFFGEIALLFNKPRIARVTALTECYLLSLQSMQFKKLFNTLPEDIRKEFYQQVNKRLGID